MYVHRFGFKATADEAVTRLTYEHIKHSHAQVFAVLLCSTSEPFYVYHFFGNINIEYLPEECM